MATRRLDREALECMLEEVYAEQENLTVPPSLVLSLIQAESNYRPQAVSSAGAAGLMQIMPATGRELAEKAGLDWSILSDEEVQQELFDAPLNIRLGTSYIDQLVKQFGNDYELGLAAYNWGQGNVRRALRRAGGRTWRDIRESAPDETRNYVKKVLEGHEL